MLFSRFTAKANQSGHPMKQVVRRGIRDITVDEVPVAALQCHHVRVRPAYSLISSGTETASIHTRGLLHEAAADPGRVAMILRTMRANGIIRTADEVGAKLKELSVLGYCGAGYVDAVHPTVTDLSPGDRVSYGGEGTGHGEYILAGRQLVARVPETVPLEHAAFTTLGSIAMNAVRISQLELGEVVAVIGLGIVGQLIAQLARLQGARVVATDLIGSRLHTASSLGTHHACLPDSVGEAVSSLTNGRGADCVIIAAASKSSAPCAQAAQIVRDRGRIAVVGAVDMSFNWEVMYRKEVRVLMSRAYGPGSYDPVYEKQNGDYPVSYVRWTENRNMEEFLRLIESGAISVAPLISHRFELPDAATAYETIMSRAVDSLAVVLRYPTGSGEEKPSVAARLTRVSLRPPATTNRATLQFALFGAGNIVRWAHMPNLLRRKDVRLRAVCSSSGVRARSFGERYGAEYISTSVEEVLSDPSIDAVLIATRNAQHASQALAALEAGKHVFVEKPMALTERECQQLREAVERSGRMIAVGFNRRFAPDYLDQKKLLVRRTGPAVINCRVCSPGISGAYWMAQPEEGGAILGEACHFVDTLTWLLESEPVRVSAYSLPTTVAEPIGENNIVASIEYSDGSIANLTYTTVGSAACAGERLEAFAPGVAAISQDFKYLRSGRTGDTRRRWFANKGYREQMDAFVDALAGRRPPAATVDEGARATIVCLRILDAARSGAAVDIDWRAR